MTQNIIDIGEREGRVINIVKAKYGLKTKSEAIALITKAYEDAFLEPELRPEYIEKLEKIKRGAKYIGPFSSVEELDKHIKSNA
ncbi:MAG: DUF2683 family protein [Nanoarchaeota archaeon]|nr:DUF2683 family protein [Nanoarchaeota archaeon]